MTRTPVVGITCDYDLKKNLRESACLYPDYFEAIEQAGGTPLLIPPVKSTRTMRQILAAVDAVVLSGGEDYHPRLYGEEPHSSWGPMLPQREVFDVQFAALLLETGLPVLGICGGIQLINIALGGSLIQHIPAMVQGALNHRSTSPKYATHEVMLEPRSQLVPGDQPVTVQVVSAHHQAVGRVASSLRVIGRSSDGVVEAVEGVTPGRYLVGLQWHPEKALPSVGPSPDFQLELFQNFIGAARRKK